MSKFDIFSADQRLLILKSLDDADFSANEGILRTCLEQYGHRIGGDLLRAHLVWLEEQGLVVISTLSNDYMVAQITDKGLDVSQGRVSVPGVKRPRPIF